MLETFLTFCNIVQNSGDFFYPHFTFLNSHFGMWSFCCQPLKCSSGSNMLICYEKTGNVVLKQMLPVTTFFFFIVVYVGKIKTIQKSRTTLLILLRVPHVVLQRSEYSQEKQKHL